MNKKINGLAALFAMSVGTSASAIPMTFTGQFEVDVDIPSYTNDGGPLSANYSNLSFLSLPSFDSSLGTLTGVSILLDSDYAHGLQARATDIKPTCQDFFCLFTDIETAVNAHNDVAMTAYLLDAPGTQLRRTSTISRRCSTSSDVDAPIFCFTGADQVSGAFDSQYDTSAYSLLDFIDGPSLQFAFQFQSLLYGDCQNDDGDSCSVLRGGLWYGNVSVTYDYSALTDPGNGPGTEPHPVPEPGSLSLVAAALFGIVFAARRRRGVSRRAHEWFSLG